MQEMKTAKAIFRFTPVGTNIACVIKSLKHNILFQTLTASWQPHYDGLYLRYGTAQQLAQAKEMFNAAKEQTP